MPNDAITLELYRYLFSSVAEEMGAALGRTAFSPNIKERRDFSCALFDRHGRMLAQAAHIPVHLGAMPASVAAAISARPLGPGDAVLLNDPYAGGTHLPDLTLVTAVFTADPRPVLCGYVASRAHHADVGGMTPGSLPLSTELFQEGLIIPPVTLVRAGAVQDDIVAMVCRNCRTPEERRGDLDAQIAAGNLGVVRLLDLVRRDGVEAVTAHGERLLGYSERLTRAAIAALPRGTCTFEDRLDDDGHGHEALPVRVTIEPDGDSLIVDFTGTAPACVGSLNAVQSITMSAVLYVVRCLVGEAVPANHGCLAPIRLVAPLGTLVNAQPPHAVAGGNVETSQRVVDALFGAFAQALPHIVPAASQGTMNNVVVGGDDTIRGRPFAYYETIAGGMGARPGKDGLSGVQAHMTNTLNTPIEALEYSYPLQVTEYALRRGSGGAGRWRGGDGLRRCLRLCAAATVTLLTERRRYAPYGLWGGESGATGVNSLIRSATGGTEALPGKVTLHLDVGDVVIVETPGGGGYGPAAERPDEQA